MCIMVYKISIHIYARSQFSVCNENILSTEEIPSKEISLRSVATAQSTGTGQGFAKCACTKKCETKKCFCKKNNLLCNSKCHGSGPCTNKQQRYYYTSVFTKKKLYLNGYLILLLIIIQVINIILYRRISHSFFR